MLLADDIYIICCSFVTLIMFRNLQRKAHSRLILKIHRSKYTIEILAIGSSVALTFCPPFLFPTGRTLYRMGLLSLVFHPRERIYWGGKIEIFLARFEFYGYRVLSVRTYDMDFIAIAESPGYSKPLSTIIFYPVGIKSD